VSSPLIPFAITALVVIGLDQITKAIVLAEIPLRDSIPVIDGFFKIVHVRNPGAAFSLFATAPEWFRTPFFLGITIVAVAALLVIAFRLPPDERVLSVALGGVLGGALGNLLDRLVHGEVIDFLYVYWREWYWPAFNVADSSITISVVAIVLHSFLVREDSGADPGGSARSTA
jgi:signal peptidase II